MDERHFLAIFVAVVAGYSRSGLSVTEGCWLLQLSLLWEPARGPKL